MNASGIECIVANRTSENVFNEQKSVQEKKVPKIVDTFYSEITKEEKPKELKNYPHHVIWYSAIPILVVFAIICGGIAIRHASPWVIVSLMMIPVVYVVLFYLIIYAINKRKENYNLSNYLIHSGIVEYIEMQKKPQIIEEFRKLFDIYEVCERVDEKIISPYCEKMNEIIERCDRLRAKLFELLSRINKEADEINYLPSGAKTEHLPKIIEFMESGAADNYQEAAYQAVQYELTNACNKAQIAIMEAAEEQRKTEARAQREMQEYYERQRLNEARQAAARQAESTRRAEQYAKEQAESAKRAEEAQRDAAKYAEKQTEIAEELLRRAKYGG